LIAIYSHRFGERAYAAEELVAELGAAFLAAEFSFEWRRSQRGLYRQLD
jgi:antirestriction protein ArdC